MKEVIQKEQEKHKGAEKHETYWDKEEDKTGSVRRT
jgi:hypothetical protein